MKRILLLLAFYVLATVGVRAQVVFGEEDSIKVLWEFETEYKSMLFHTPMYFSSDMSYVLNTCWYDGNYYDKKNHIQQRSIETGEVVKEYEAKRPEKFTAFDVSKDGKYIAFSKFGINDTIITILDQNTLEFVKEIKIDRGNLFKGFDAGYIQSLKISPDSKYVVAAIKINTQVYDPFIKYQGYTAVYNLETGEFIKEISLSINFEGDFHILDYSSDGKYLAGAAKWSYLDQNEKTVEKSGTIIFDTKTWLPVFREEKPCSYIQFSPDGSYLTISYYKIHDNNEIKLYNIAEKTSETYNMNVQRAFLTEDNNYLIGEKVLDINNNNVYSLEKWVYFPPRAYDEYNSLLLAGSDNDIKLLHFDINSLITSISQDNENLGLYPNPASDYIEINLDGAHLEGGPHQNIEIYDVLGGSVPNMSTSVPSGHLRQRRTIRVDVSTLPKGVYFVKVGDRIEKFVKM